MNMLRILPSTLFLAIIVGCGPSAHSAGDEAAIAASSGRVEAVESEISAEANPVFDEVMAFARAEQLHLLPIGESMTALGEWFSGQPYVAGTLDASPIERLVVKLDGFDCVTFVETVLALARGVRKQDYSYGTFVENLTDQRYRDREIDGYCSRLHYFSEWISDNEARGTVENITADLGGDRLEKTLNFMSQHRESYPRLVENDSLFAGIMEMEKRLEGLELYFIPQDRIRTVYPNLQSGDILALATDIGGLDVAHTGLAYGFEDGSIGLLHASTTLGVTVSQDLQTYVENNRRQIGIVVARPK